MRKTRTRPFESFVVLDLETRHSARDLGGWTQIPRMGVSVACVFDSKTGEFKTYLEEDVPQLLFDLYQAELIVGFNTLRFDYGVLDGYHPADIGILLGDPVSKDRIKMIRAVHDREGLSEQFRVFWNELSRGHLPYLRQRPCFDMLKYVHQKLGYRIKLDSLCKRTLGERKSGDGLQALELFRAGRMDVLTTYCIEDVRLTRDLFLFGCRNGYVRYYNKKARAQESLVVTWDKLLTPDVYAGT